MIPINITIEVSTSILGDLAITFAESGQIGFWRCIDSYDWKRWTEPSEFVGKSLEVEDDFVFYTIEYENPIDNNPPRLRTDITPALLAKGISLFGRSNPMPTDGIEYMDAAEADLVVQYAIFGEEVYS
jgi:hypothetical protein